MIKDSINTELSSDLLLVYLKSLLSLNLVIKQITQALSFLAVKRPTLAEKAIQEELVLCAELESLLLYSLSTAIKQKYPRLSESDCSKLRRINIKLSKQLRAFIKAATYNLNYLEQYFEHNFWLELSNNKFAEQLSQFIILLEIKKH